MMSHACALRAVSKFLVALAPLASAVGCATTIPDTDTTPPRVELRISGPGVGNQTMSNPPRDLWVGPGGIQYLELVAGADYRFTLLVTDDGGVSRAYLSLPENLELSDVEPAGVVTMTDALLHRMTIAGNRADPRTALTITGRMGTRGATNMSFPYNAEGDDFGGRTRAINQTFLTVEAFIASTVP